MEVGDGGEEGNVFINLKRLGWAGVLGQRKEKGKWVKGVGFYYWIWI